MEIKIINKEDVEFIADIFYIIHDHVNDVVREMKKIARSIENDKSDPHILLNHYCIARHDKNIIVASYNRDGYNYDVQFPVHYLYDKNWPEEYRAKLIKEKEEAEVNNFKYAKERDMNEINRLKKLYPEHFK